VIRALEGSLSVVDCVEENGLCEKAEDCVTRDVWKEVTRAIERVLENLTLEDLAQRQRQRAAEPLTYTI